MSEADADPLEDVLTVAELNRRISEVVDDAESLHRVRCLGEVSDVSVYEWGTFLDLVYEGHQLSALMWASRWRDLDVELEPGMEVICDGDVDFYADDGAISLKPWDVQVVGDGDRAIRLQQLRTELEERGWFDETHKQSLPAVPSRVGVVTSVDGDARFDIQESIHGRYPDVDLLLQDAYVQGDRAPASIASGVHALDRRSDVDVIVVGRGGGSETDLWAFNTEDVCEAVFTASTPVIAAVGHREDDPLVCSVADAVAITPTEAGVTVVPDRSTLESEIHDLHGRVERAYTDLVSNQLVAFDDRVDDAFDSVAVRRLAALDDRVDAAVDDLERTRERMRLERRYRAVVGVLIALLFVLLLGVLLLVL